MHELLLTRTEMYLNVKTRDFLLQPKYKNKYSHKCNFKMFTSEHCQRTHTLQSLYTSGRPQIKSSQEIKYHQHHPGWCQKDGIHHSDNYQNTHDIKKDLQFQKNRVIIKQFQRLAWMRILSRVFKKTYANNIKESKRKEIIHLTNILTESI